MSTVSTTIPGRTASRNWKRIAKDIATSGGGLSTSRCKLNLLDDAYSPYNYDADYNNVGRYVNGLPIEEQYMLALFIAQFVLTDGVME